MTHLIVLFCLISTPAFARYEDTVQRGQKWFASDEYRRQQAAQAEEEAVREAPILNKKLIVATQRMAQRFHRGLASGISETRIENGRYILRVDFRTGDGYDCKGERAHGAWLFECVHTVRFNERNEYYTDDFLFGSPKRKR